MKICLFIYYVNTHSNSKLIIKCIKNILLPVLVEKLLVEVGVSIYSKIVKERWIYGSIYRSRTHFRCVCLSAFYTLTLPFTFSFSNRFTLLLPLLFFLVSNPLILLLSSSSFFLSFASYGFPITQFFSFRNKNCNM